MINGTTIRDMDVYASDVSAIKEEPDAENYPLGVKNGWTAPAKWWNWLFNELTTRVGEERADVTVIVDEIKAILSEVNIQPDATNNAQLKAAVLAILQRIAGLNTPGMVKSSDTNGQVQVLSSGVMEVNGVGNFADLPPALSSANTLIDAIDIIYEQLQALTTGVPPQPSSYDTSNPILDTTQLSGEAAQFGEVSLGAGWYYIDIAGGGGGARGTRVNQGARTVLNGGRGLRATGWIFVYSPGLYLYGVGAGGEHSIYDVYDGNFTHVGSGGTCGLAQLSAIKPSFLDGKDGAASDATGNIDNTFGGTGGASILFSCPTQEAYCVAGGSGGKWEVKNTVTLVNAMGFTVDNIEDGITYHGALAQNETIDPTSSSALLPWTIMGNFPGGQSVPLTWSSGATGGARGKLAFNSSTYTWDLTQADGGDGWVKIYRGITAAPST